MPCGVPCHHQKGKGYAPAEEHPSRFHGVGPFDCATGAMKSPSALTFSDTFGDTMLQLGKIEPKLCAITAAMPDRTGLTAFASAYPRRTFDVGIAEGHAVSMAGGLAKAGDDPSGGGLLDLPPAGLRHDPSGRGHASPACDFCGGPGGTGGGGWGRPITACLMWASSGRYRVSPFCAPAAGQASGDAQWAVQKCDGPVAIRYPRGGDGAFLTGGRETLFRVGRDITLVTYGTMINQVLPAADQLAERGIEAEVFAPSHHQTPGHGVHCHFRPEDRPPSGGGRGRRRGQCGL